MVAQNQGARCSFLGVKRWVLSLHTNQHVRWLVSSCRCDARSWAFVGGQNCEKGKHILVQKEQSDYLNNHTQDSRTWFTVNVNGSTDSRVPTRLRVNFYKSSVGRGRFLGNKNIFHQHVRPHHVNQTSHKWRRISLWFLMKRDRGNAFNQVWGERRQWKWMSDGIVLWHLME